MHSGIEQSSRVSSATVEHLPPDVIRKYIGGEFRIIEAEKIARHIQACQQCRDQFEDLRLARARLRARTSP